MTTTNVTTTNARAGAVDAAPAGRVSLPRRTRTVSPTGGALGPVGWGLLIVIAAFGLLPMYWLLASSVTPDNDAFATGFHPVPTHLTLSHFRAFFNDPALVRYLVNSVVVSLLTAGFSVLVSAYTAYSFSKFRYRGRTTLMSTVLVGQLFPQSLLLLTLYVMMQRLGLLDTYWALVLSYTTFTLPLCVFMLKGFFDAVPTELIEAAKVDGARQRTIIHRVLLPVMAPGLVAAGLFAFVRAWNDFLFALTLTSQDKQTLPPGLVRAFINESQANWPDLMAASLVVSLPVVIAFVLLQRHLVAGLAAGAVKG